jgi:hypothetical protein
MRHNPHCVFHYGINFVFFVYQLHKSPKIVCCSGNEWNGGVGLGDVRGKLGGVGLGNVCSNSLVVGVGLGDVHGKIGRCWAW